MWGIYILKLHLCRYNVSRCVKRQNRPAVIEILASVLYTAAGKKIAAHYCGSVAE